MWAFNLFTLNYVLVASTRNYMCTTFGTFAVQTLILTLLQGSLNLHIRDLVWLHNECP